MRKLIESDEETRNLKISDHDLFEVYRYLLIRDEKRADGYEAVLRTEPYVEIIFRPTIEKEQQLKREHIRRNLKFFDSEIYIQDVELKDFEVTNDERLKAYEAAENFLNTYKKDNYIKGLFLYGSYRTGKSFLISAIAEKLAERNIQVLFCYMPDLVRNIKQGLTEGNLEERINELKQADVLMLDDVGGENMTPWFRDEIFGPILQYRLSAKLPVFMTSNYDYIGLVNILKVGREETDRLRAVRILQRIKDLMIAVKLEELEYKDF